MKRADQKPDLEVEYRFKVYDKKRLIKLLNSLIKKPVKRVYELSVMFDNPHGLMQTTNGRVRVRTIGRFKKVFTYKKPVKTNKSVNKELEYEVEFRDENNQIEKILNAMEFDPTTSYERYRTEWKVNKSTIMLDEYPFADLLEIEGPEKDIISLSKKFGFNPRGGLTKACDTLFQEWRKERGLPFKPHMRFNDFDK